MQLKVTNVSYDILNYGYIAGHPTIFIDFDITDETDEDYDPWQDFIDRVEEKHYISAIDGSHKVCIAFRESCADSDDKVMFLQLFMNKLFMESKAFQELNFDPTTVENVDDWQPNRPIVILITNPVYGGNHYYQRFDTVYVEHGAGQALMWGPLMNVRQTAFSQVNFKVGNTFDKKEEEDYSKFIDLYPTDKVIITLPVDSPVKDKVKKYALDNELILLTY